MSGTQWAWGGALREATPLPETIRHLNQRLKALEQWTRTPYVAGSLEVAGAVTVGGSARIGSTTTGGNLNLFSSSYGNNGIVQSFGTDGLLKFQAGALGVDRAFVYANTSSRLELYANGTERARFHVSGGISLLDATDPGASTVRVGGALTVTGAAGINGKTPVTNVAAPTAAGGTYGATEQALLNDIRTRLINFGIYP